MNTIWIIFLFIKIQISTRSDRKSERKKENYEALGQKESNETLEILLNSSSESNIHNIIMHLSY